MSLRPVCGRVYCDHEPEERGQALDEMLRPPTEEEKALWDSEPADSHKKIELAKRNAHLPVD